MKNIEKHTEVVYKIFSRVSKESNKNLALQKFLQIILYSRVATGIELEGDINVPKNMNPKVKEILNSETGDIWLKVNDYSDELAEKDPQMALDLAVGLWNLDTSSGNIEQNEVNAFLATTGLTILGNEKIKEKLATYFENDEGGEQLASALRALMEIDLSSFVTTEAFSDPQAYSTLAAIYAGLGLKGEVGAKAKELYEFAKQRALAGDVKNAFKIEIENFKDCNFMEDRFNEVYIEQQ